MSYRHVMMMTAMSQSRFVDAVIVGGGPAGALAAIKLAQLGWRTVLVERGQRHRNKSCGHCLNARAMIVLEEEGLLESVKGIADGTLRMVRVRCGGDRGQPLELALPKDGNSHSGLIVDRARFDQLLLDHAATLGVRIVQPASAKIVMKNEGGVTIRIAGPEHEDHLAAKLVIGADGLGSGVARAAGFTRRLRAGRKYGFSFNVLNVASHAARAFSPGVIEMFIAPGGYVGVINQGDDRLHVAGLVNARTEHAPRDPLSFARAIACDHEMLRRAGMDRVHHEKRVEHFAAIGPMPWRPGRIADRHVVLIGDAAGYVEPFTGQGMSWALQSAEVFAETLHEARPGTWNEQLAREYTRRWKQRFAGQQRFCRMVSFALMRPRVWGWGRRFSNVFPRIARRSVERVVTQ